MNTAIGTLVSAEAVGVFAAGVLTLVVLSYVIGDNVAYRLVQHVFVGLTAGYVFLIAYHHILQPKLVQPISLSIQRSTAPPAMLIVTAIFGLLLLLRLFRPTGELVSIPLALVIGAGAGLALVGALSGTLIPQSATTAAALLTPTGVGDLVGRWVLLVGVIAVLLSFSIFGAMVVGGTGGSALAGIRQGGRWLLLVSLGALFVGIATSRFAFLAERVAFFANEWLPRVFGGLG